MENGDETNRCGYHECTMGIENSMGFTFPPTGPAGRRCLVLNHLESQILSKGGKSQATGLSRYSRGNFISAGVDGIVNLFEEFFLLEGCGVGLYSLSFYNLSVGSPYARPKNTTHRKNKKPGSIMGLERNVLPHDLLPFRNGMCCVTPHSR